MRVTGLGKLILLILVIGAAFGGWRVFQNMNKSGGANNGNANNGGTSLFGKNNGGNNTGNNGNNTGNNTGNNGSNSNGNNSNGSGNSGNSSTQSGGNSGTFTGGTAASGNEILLVTSNTKKGWLVDEISKFNAQNGDKYKIVTKFIETREAMHAILEGKVKPAIWSPSSTIWTQRLSQAWQQKNGNAILNLNDGDKYRVFFRSPLVFLTTKRKLNALKPVLKSWDTLRASNGRTSQGALKWAHADPLTANSGMMTLGLMLADYTAQTGSDPAIAASSAKFRTYVSGISRGLVFDLPAQGGSSALTKAFLQNTSRYDFITTYESNAIEAALNDPSLAVIYPNPTAVSESVGAVINGDWLSDTQREGARAFLQFLGSEKSMREGLNYYFRPAQSGGNLSLSPVLSKLRAQGFQQSFSSAELPPYEALNAAAFAWRNSIAKKATQ